MVKMNMGNHCKHGCNSDTRVGTIGSKQGKSVDVTVLSLAQAPQATVITLAYFGMSGSGRSESGNLINKDICYCNTANLQHAM